MDLVTETETTWNVPELPAKAYKITHKGAAIRII